MYLGRQPVNKDLDNQDSTFFLYAVLTPADAENHIDKQKFTVPFVCGARNLGEALRRIAEGAAMIRTKGEAGTGRNTGLKENCRGRSHDTGQRRGWNR